MLPEFPDVEVDKINVMENPEPFRALGLTRFPALASDAETLSAIWLTRRRIRRFLKRL